jgi:hypothetical protein
MSSAYSRRGPVLWFIKLALKATRNQSTNRNHYSAYRLPTSTGKQKQLVRHQGKRDSRWKLLHGNNWLSKGCDYSEGGRLASAKLKIESRSQRKREGKRSDPRHFERRKKNSKRGGFRHPETRCRSKSLA